ncbi:hypothetical protein SORBI_3005G180150 [Sorghum bicolor]|uniref:Uncharacterized protein n=1 Tax=Sorghum bicolor TaxID=4558 RepID=A0A1Z5RK21_SORBI|nr:hypothetical protein SORBI_3005G180150 [Sorghum bicolor]
MTKTSLSRQEQAEKVSCWTHSTQSSWVAWWACRKLLGWDTLAKAALELVNLFFKCKEVKLCRLSAVRVGIWLHGEGVPHEIEIVVTSDLAGTNE